MNVVMKNEEERDCALALIHKTDRFVDKLGRGGIVRGPVCEIECSVMGWTGHPDWLVQLKDGTLAVVDWKTGRGEVADSNQNAQLLGYAVAANQLARMLGWPAPEGNMLPVIADIVQIGEPVVPVEYSPQDLSAAADDLIEWKREAEAPYAPRVPSTLGCAYCPALGTDRCPETMQITTALSKVEPNSISAMDGDRLFAVYEAGQIVEKLMKKAKDEIKARLNRGEAVGDLCFGTPKKSRAITRTEEAFSALLLGGVDQATAFKCVSFSVPSCEEAIGEEKTKELLGPLIEIKESAAPLTKAKK